MSMYTKTYLTLVVAAALFFLPEQAFAQRDGPNSDRVFAAALNHVLAREGGWANHPDDRGGPTWSGITLPVLRVQLGEPVGAGDLRKLDEGEVAAFYYEVFWDRPACRELSPGVREFFFDSAVMSGERNAVRMLQRAAGLAETEVDGVFGPKTLEAVAAHRADALLVALVAERLRFVRAIVANDPSQAIFLKGWEARIERAYAEARQLVDQAR